MTQPTIDRTAVIDAVSADLEAGLTVPPWAIAELLAYARAGAALREAILTPLKNANGYGVVGRLAPESTVTAYDTAVSEAQAATTAALLAKCGAG